jgi:hypothetical protein
VLPLLAWPISRTMPWVTLISGCLAGTGYLAVMARVAGASRSPLDPGTVRLAFLPAIAALAFVLRAPFRPVTQATPVSAWLAPAGHIVLAVPVLAVTCCAACADRSRYADLGGAIAAPVSFAAIATAGLALSCAAMRDRWHRYTRRLHRLSSPRGRPPCGAGPGRLARPGTG